MFSEKGKAKRESLLGTNCSAFHGARNILQTVIYFSRMFGALTTELHINSSD